MEKRIINYEISADFQNFIIQSVFIQNTTADDRKFHFTAAEYFRMEKIELTHKYSNIVIKRISSMLKFY